jgi:hypothetical protein
MKSGDRMAFTLLPDNMVLPRMNAKPAVIDESDGGVPVPNLFRGGPP